MTWSAPMCLTKAHLAAPPADPMTVCPLSLAIWHTTDPTAPEAADTNTTSPGLGIAIFSKPTQAVSPGMPATPRNAWGGSPNVSSFCRLPAGALNRSRQPNQEETRSPGLNRGSSEAATSPIAPPSSASPSWKGGRQPYMVELDAASSKLSGLGMPIGRDFRRISRDVIMVGFHSEAWFDQSLTTTSVI